MSSNYSLMQRLLDNEKYKAQQVYLRQPSQGQWKEYTWAEVMHQARQLALFLLNLGLKRGNHVAIFSKNCAEWFIADFGITLAGMVNVSLFPNQNQAGIEYVIQHAEIKLVFVGKLDKHRVARGYIPAEITTISFDYHHDLVTDYKWSQVLAGKPLTELTEPADDDIYTIIYSSGTSGRAKGSVYTHGAISNYLAVIAGDIQRLTTSKHLRLLSYLPLAHVYERSSIELGSVVLSSDVSFIESLDTFISNLHDVKPTLFTAVPRIWSVFKSKIESRLSAKALNFLLSIPGLAHYLKKSIRSHLGLSETTNFISGSAHLPKVIYNFFDKLDIPIQEGYGQTENLAYATFSLLPTRRVGYVGTPRLQVEVKLGPDNELLVKCPCLMKEYYKEPIATAATITQDGWLRTGDIAEIDSLQRVKIFGRISEHFKNQKGEFISPALIEKRFSLSPIIEQSCLVGRELDSNILLVSLTTEARKTPISEIKVNLKQLLHQINPDLQGFEKISQILVTKDAWNSENNLLTPTLKVKRGEIEKRYQSFIQRALSDHQPVVFESV